MSGHTVSALDSSLEALAFGYLSYGFATAVNNIWAWAAVVTAAVSLWRINRGSGLGLSSSPRGGGGQLQQHVAAAPLLTPSQPSEMAAAEETDEGLCSTSSACETTSSRCVGDHDGGVVISKVKFSLYYDNNVEEEEGLSGGSDDHGVVEDDDDDEEEVISTAGRLGLWWRTFEDWDRTMRNAGQGEMGWYRCQDLTILDGSVVRLWDGGHRRRRHAAVSVADGGVAW